LPILISAIIILGLLFLAFPRVKKETGKSWLQFFAKGKEEGFSFKEIEMLRHLVVQCGFESPCSLFDSQLQIDKCIRSMIRSIKISGESDERETQDFLSKLYDYRKKIEIDKPLIKTSISDSTQIDEGQALQIQVPGSGVFQSRVIKNTSQYMTISRPVNENGSSSLSSWTGKKISVYFWREDDAGYVFDSGVLDEVYSKGYSSLKITHGASLFRTQRRKSVRIKMHKAAFLYLVPEDEPAHKLETNPGVKCFLKDVSDSGCAVTIGGKANAGLRVKVQFELDNAAICMTGTIRSTTLIDDTNRSVLHIESELLPVEIRNRIFGKIFGMQPEETEDDLPFRILDSEIKNFHTNGNPPNDKAVENSGGAISASISDDALISETIQETGGN